MVTPSVKHDCHFSTSIFSLFCVHWITSRKLLNYIFKRPWMCPTNIYNRWSLNFLYNVKTRWAFFTRFQSCLSNNSVQTYSICIIIVIQKGHNIYYILLSLILIKLLSSYKKSNRTLTLVLGLTLTLCFAKFEIRVTTKTFTNKQLKICNDL